MGCSCHSRSEVTLWHLKHYTQRRIIFCKYVVIFNSKEIANDSFVYIVFVYAKFTPCCINRTESRNTAECTSRSGPGVCLLTSVLRRRLYEFISSVDLSPEYQPSNLTPECPTDISNLLRLKLTSGDTPPASSCLSRWQLQTPSMPARRLETFPPLFPLLSTSRHEESYWHWIGFRISTEPDLLLSPLCYSPVLCCCCLSPLLLDWSPCSHPCVPISALAPILFSMQWTE